MTRILILNDDADLRTLMVLILEREGFEPVYADDNQDAANLLKDGSYKLLIMDYGLPGLDWWEFYNSMKTDPLLRTIGIIILLPRFMISEEGESRFRKVLDNGDGLLTKPFSVEDFIELVKKVLGNYGSAAPVLG